VALSETDPVAADITASIAYRVSHNPFNEDLGFAGLASVAQGQGTKGLTINTVSFSIGNVRTDQYMMARRLFLQRNPAGSGDSARDAAENVLFEYATGWNNATQSYDSPITHPEKGRCAMDPIVTAAGFVSCFDNCGAACTATNLCCTPPGDGASIPKQSIGAEMATDPSSTVWSDLGDASHPCVNTNVKSLATTSCGIIAETGGIASGDSCTVNSRCATGTSCVSVGPSGSGVGEICQ
jgi:hypothetical protein